MIFSKRQFNYVVLLAALSSVVQADCDVVNSCQNFSQNLWQPRAFSSYKTREFIALQDHDTRENLLSFSVEYMQSFGCASDRLGALPFWSGTNTMTIGTNDGKSDLDAYQFGLGEVTTPGSITLNPKVQHVGGEMLWRVAHSSDQAGPYFQVKVPLAAMMIETKVTEIPAVVSSAEDADWTRYSPQSVRFDTITEALRSDFEHRSPDLQFGRLASGRNTVIRCADIEAVAGYNFYAAEKGYFGAGFKVTCPTGNVPSAKYILEPVVGRAGHWGVGAEMQGAYDIYQNDDVALHLGVRGDILHLFSGRTPSYRSFDLALNGAGSKYLLVQHYVSGLIVSGTAPNQTLTESRMAEDVLPAINITTAPVKSSFAVEGSFALSFTAQKDNWNASLIGEFWGRTHERLKIDCDALSKFKEFELNNYAVLGRQIDIKFTNVASPVQALNLCEPKAKIGKSADRKITVGEDAANGILDATVAANRIPSDHNVALDIAGAQAPRALTGKVSAEVGYTWMENNLAPHVSVFGGVEFADKKSRFPRLWSVGVQGSMVF